MVDVSRGSEPTPVRLGEGSEIPPGFEYVASCFGGGAGGVEGDVVVTRGCDCAPDLPCDPTRCTCCRNADGLPAYDANGRLKRAVCEPAGSEAERDDIGFGVGVIRECGVACRCGPECVNRSSRLGVVHKLSVRLAPGGCGLGVFADEDIPAGSRVCGYHGEAIDAAEATRRLRANDELGANNYVLLLREAEAEASLGDGGVRVFGVDPTRAGCVGRWLNHACDGGNLAPTLVRRAGERRPEAAFFAARDVAAGEELRWRYGAPSRGADGASRARRKCACGTSACLGWMPFDRGGEDG